MMRRILLSFILAVLLPSFCYSQHYIKEIKSKDITYLHKDTGLGMPAEIGEYKREGVYAFDRKKKNIGANYRSGTTKVSVFTYPAYDGYEDRLRIEFFNGLAGIMEAEGLEGQHFEVNCVSFNSGKYLIHGLSAQYTLNYNSSLLSLYECGHWWLKFRITDKKDSVNLQSIEEQFKNSLTPDILISSSPLNDKFDVYFQKTAFRDSLMLGCVMGEAYAKIDWMMENLDSLELQAGVPSLYLDYFIAGINGALEFAQKHPEFSSTDATKRMLDFYFSVREDGYLEELIHEEKKGGISIPDNIDLDMDGYHQWLIDHPLNEDLFYDHAIISKK